MSVRALGRHTAHRFGTGDQEIKRLVSTRSHGVTETHGETGISPWAASGPSADRRRFCDCQVAPGETEESQTQDRRQCAEGIVFTSFVSPGVDRVSKINGIAVLLRASVLKNQRRGSAGIPYATFYTTHDRHATSRVRTWNVELGTGTRARCLRAHAYARARLGRWSRARRTLRLPQHAPLPCRNRRRDCVARRWHRGYRRDADDQKRGFPQSRRRSIATRNS